MIVWDRSQASLVGWILMGRLRRNWRQRSADLDVLNGGSKCSGSIDDDHSDDGGTGRSVFQCPASVGMMACLVVLFVRVLLVRALLVRAPLVRVLRRLQGSDTVGNN
jgi:hypothetical protein